MTQIITSGSVNITALQDPDLYVQIQPPPTFIRGVPTDVIGLVGTASWGPVNLPVHMGSGVDATTAFGAVASASLFDPFDLATDLQLAFGQATSNATLEGWAVRVTDGTDTAASVSVTGAATATPATATVSGTITAGDVCSLTLTSTGFAGSPQTVNYTVKGTDTIQTIATGLAAAVNNNPFLNLASIYASVAGAIVTVYWLAALSPTIVVTKNVTGAATETITIASGSTSTAGATVSALYTGILGAKITMTVAASPSTLNASNVTIAGFQGTAEFFPAIPNVNFWRNLQNALAQGLTNYRGPSRWVRLTTINAAVGAPAPGVYALTGGSDGRLGVTTSIMLGNQNSTPRTGVWALTNLVPNVSIAWLVGVTDSNAVATMDSFALTNGSSVLFPFPTGTSTTTAITAVQNDGIGGPEFIYVKDSIYWQDTVNNLRRQSLPTPVIGGFWATLSPEQSPLNKKVQLVLGTERNDPVNGTIPYTPSELGQLNTAGIMIVSNPCPGGNYFGIRTAASTSPLASTQPVEYWRLTMFIARSIDATLGTIVGQLQSSNPQDPVRDAARSLLNSFGDTLTNNGQIQSGIGFCEFSQNATAQAGLGINTPASIAAHYLYALFRATYLSSVWFFVVNVQGGTTVITVQPGQA